MAENIARITDLITPTVTHLGYDIVRVTMIGTPRRQTLQIMAERQDGTGMTVEDCEVISKSLSALLDVEDPISAEYNLEVSSPGIDRPLTRLADFDRFAGHLANVELQIAMPQENGPARKKFQGDLIGTDGSNVRLKLDTQEEVSLPFSDIARAKLVLTDKLIEAAISN